MFQFFYVTSVDPLRDFHITKLPKPEGGSSSRVPLRQIVHCAVLCLSGNTCQVFGVKSGTGSCTLYDRGSKQLDSDHDQLQVYRFNNKRKLRVLFISFRERKDTERMREQEKKVS